MRFSILFVSVATAEKIVTYDAVTRRLKIEDTEKGCEIEIVLRIGDTTDAARLNGRIKAAEVSDLINPCFPNSVTPLAGPRENFKAVETELGQSKILHCEHSEFHTTIGQIKFPLSREHSGTLDDHCIYLANTAKNFRELTPISDDGTVSEFVAPIEKHLVKAVFGSHSVIVEKGGCKLTVFLSYDDAESARADSSKGPAIFNAINPCDASSGQVSEVASSGLKARHVDHANHRRIVSCYRETRDFSGRTSQETIAELEYTAQYGAITGHTISASSDQALCGRINTLVDKVKAIV